VENTHVEGKTMIAGNPNRIAPAAPAAAHPAPRRQIAFSAGSWQITYTGTDPRSPRTALLAGSPTFGPAGVRVPIITDDRPSSSVRWIDEKDVIAVTAPPVAQPARSAAPRTGGGRHRAS
jgi:hypothetical protein